MDKERLTKYYDKMSPTDSQKKRMKKAILSHEKIQKSPSTYDKGWSFSKVSKVVVSVVLALIILGNISLVGKATVGIMDMLNNYYETMLDIVENLEHLEVMSEFSVEKHENYVVMFRYRGLSQERAEEEAFYEQLREMAIINRGIELGFYPSVEDAKQRAREIYEEWEKTKENENHNIIIENVEILKSEIDDPRTKDDEYWVEMEHYTHAFSIMYLKVMEYEMKENPNKQWWNELERDIIMDFILSETQQINEFKKEIGLE